MSLLSVHVVVLLLLLSMLCCQWARSVQPHLLNAADSEFFVVVLTKSMLQDTRAFPLPPEDINLTCLLPPTQVSSSCPVCKFGNLSRVLTLCDLITVGNIKCHVSLICPLPNSCCKSAILVIQNLGARKCWPRRSQDLNFIRT